MQQHGEREVAEWRDREMDSDTTVLMFQLFRKTDEEELSEMVMEAKQQHTMTRYKSNCLYKLLTIMQQCKESWNKY